MRVVILLMLSILLMDMCGISLLSAYDRVRVTVTIEPLALIVKDIGGDRVDVYTIVPAYMNPHVYAPKPGDRSLIENSDIFICIGREEFLGYFEDVPAIKLELDDWSSGMYIPGGNPHYVWLFPPNAVIVAEAIYTVLSSIDHDGRNYYRHRFEQFKQSLVDVARWVEACKRTYRLNEVRVALAGSHMEPLMEYLGIEVTGILIRGERMVAPRDIVEFRSSAKSADIILVHLLEYELDEGRIASEVSKEVGIPIITFNPLPLGYESSYTEYLRILSYGLSVSLANVKLGYQNRATSPMLCIVAIAPLTMVSIFLLFLLHRKYRR